MTTIRKAANPAPSGWRVTCLDFTRYRPTEAAAEAWLLGVERAGNCRNLHTIEVLIGDEWLPRHIARARDILAAKLGAVIDTPDGPLTIGTAGWSKETAERSDVRAAQALNDHGAYIAALGPHDHATLTSDARGARTDGWCQCTPQPAVEAWVRYERWTVEGRAGHGFLCPSCRFLTQVG